MCVANVALVAIGTRLELTVLPRLINLVHHSKLNQKKQWSVFLSMSSARTLSASVATKVADILWCSNLVCTLGTVASLRDYMFVLANVCELLMQCTPLTAQTNAWLERNKATPAMREPINPSSVSSGPTKVLMDDYVSTVLQPSISTMFEKLSERDCQQRAARLQLYGCWSVDGEHDELVEALFYGYIYIVSNVYGSILSGSSQVNADLLLNVCSDLLFPHSDPRDLRSSQHRVMSSAILDDDSKLGDELADRYLHMQEKQRTNTLYKASKATLSRHFTRMVSFARQFSQNHHSGSTVSARVNNRLRAFAYQYDGWCHAERVRGT